MLVAVAMTHCACSGCLYFWARKCVKKDVHISCYGVSSHLPKKYLDCHLSHGGLQMWQDIDGLMGSCSVREIRCVTLENWPNLNHDHYQHQVSSWMRGTVLTSRDHSIKPPGQKASHDAVHVAKERSSMQFQDQVKAESLSYSQNMNQCFRYFLPQTYLHHSLFKTK